MLTIALTVLFTGCGGRTPQTVLYVALPETGFIQDADSNYYLNWLEERTGIDLEITLVKQPGGGDYLDALFSSEADIDVVMFGGDFTVTEEEIARYAESGDIFREGDSTCYYNYGAFAASGVGQVLWINYEWLRKLDLPIPSTTEELYTVLKAFREKDPNGNGLQDEIPLVGAVSDYCYSPWEILLNSFVYNDPYHSRFDPNSGVFTGSSDEAREGLKYLHRLYAEWLLDERSFEYSLSDLSELVNSPLDLVGAFTTYSICDVIYQCNPEVMARFMHVLPIAGPTGVRHALYHETEPTVAAIITGRGREKEAAKLLLETMLTEEASLIARYGEEGVDWSFSEGQDVSVYGSASTIVTRNYIWNTFQNKHLNGIGPMKVPEKYLAGVTWNGVNSDAEYIDGRAYVSYRAYLPVNRELKDRNEALSFYTDSWYRDFITGTKDIESDRAWEEYLNGLEY